MIGKCFMPEQTTIGEEMAVGTIRSTEHEKVENLVLREELIDICSILHLDCSSIVDTALYIYRQINPSEKFDFFSKKSRAVLAFSIWEALNRQNAPRTMLEIALLCHVPPKCVLDVESRFPEHVTHPKLACFPCVEEMCRTLNRDYHDISAIKEILTKVEGDFYGRDGKAVIAACIILYMAAHEWEYNMTVSEFLKLHNVSRRCTMSIIRKLEEKEYPFFLSGAGFEPT